VKGDFSRITYDPRQHFRRVLMQQGRVEIDADGNEQVAIDGHVDRTTTYDVIGESGVPLTLLPDGTPAGGFRIGLGTGGTDLTISKGRMYVEGLLAENDSDGASFLHQPDLPLDPTSTTSSLGLEPGYYVAYLDVWERLVTSLDDPAIKESALGGPDTSARAKLVWQVKLTPAPGTSPPTCETVGEAWRPAASQGALAVRTGAPPVDSLPCILPPETGYRRLENQLYRVEIHTPGGYGTATFKWSRENGSVVAGVVDPPGSNATTATGPAFSVTSSGRDASLAFAAGDWVELTDDHSELGIGRGELLQVQGPPTDTLVTTATAAANPVTLSLHPKLRRWDQTGAGLDQGVTIVDASWVELEDGIEVQFGAGPFNTGDYWTVPARTKTSTEQGHIEWPVDASGNPVALPPRGIRHHYAKLAIVEVTAQGFSGPIADCRLAFPPLTEIGANACACTITAIPGPGWERPILALFAGGGHVDAEICFPVGEFPTSGPVIINTTGDVKVEGAGWGTRIGAAAGETALGFVGCASVEVRDLCAWASTVDAPADPAKKGVNGVLEFHNCGDVLVDHVALRCAGGHERGASCVTVRSDVNGPNVTTGAGSARILRSRLDVGQMQFGVLLVHQARGTVEDNIITSVRSASAETPLSVRLQDARFLTAARSFLVAEATTARTATAPAQRPAAPPATPATTQTGLIATSAAPETPTPTTARPVVETAGTLVSVRAGNQTVSFTAYPGLQSTWQTFLDQNAPSEFATQRDALAFVKASADRILTEPALRAQFSGFEDIVRIIAQRDVGSAQRGIAVGGQAVGDLHILGNTIAGVLQGITVGVSHRAAISDAPDHTQTVSIRDNHVDVVLDVLAKTAARYGIFVGNCNSLQIEGNRLTMHVAGAGADALPADGVRVWGYLGKKMVVRHNQVTSFETGIRVVVVTAVGQVSTRAPTTPSTNPTRSGPLWLVADNVLESVHDPIAAPATVVVGNAVV